MTKTIELNNIVYTVDTQADIPPGKYFYSELTKNVHLNQTSRNVRKIDWSRDLIISCSDRATAARLGVPVTGEQEENREERQSSAIKKALESIPPEELKRIMDEVNAMNIGGPTIEQYFASFGNMTGIKEDGSRERLYTAQEIQTIISDLIDEDKSGKLADTIANDFGSVTPRDDSIIGLVCEMLYEVFPVSQPSHGGEGE